MAQIKNNFDKATVAFSRQRCHIDPAFRPVPVTAGKGGNQLVSIHKWPICLISALCSKFYPRNINYMHPKGISFRAPAVKFFACLDLNPICLFLDGHQLLVFRFYLRFGYCNFGYFRVRVQAKKTPRKPSYNKGSGVLGIG